jgi:hypothetical protein
VPEQLLDGPRIPATSQEVGGEAVTQRMGVAVSGRSNARRKRFIIACTSRGWYGPRLTYSAPSSASIASCLLRALGTECGALGLRSAATTRLLSACSPPGAQKSHFACYGLMSL